MHINTFKSLISLSLYAVLSTSVVAIPIQDHDAHNAVTQRSLADVDGMGSSLYRRNATTSGRKAPVRSGSVSNSQGLTRSPTIDSTKKGGQKGADTITICVLPNGASKVGKRGFFENILYGRAGTTTVNDIDPGYAHHVSAGPPLSGQPIARGLFGAVYINPQNGGQVIKHIVSSSWSRITPGELGSELANLRKASQLIQWYYVLFPGTVDLKEVWVYMPKIPGTSVAGFGFDLVGADRTPAALQRGQTLRATFLNKVVELTINRAVAYASQRNVQHLDLHMGNVMVVLKPGTTTYEVQSVDLVDWGVAQIVTGCTPQNVAQITAEVTHRFRLLY